MRFDWSFEKNLLLIETRGVSFEEAAAAIRDGGLLADEPHPNRAKHPNQRIMVIAIRDYCYVARMFRMVKQFFSRRWYRTAN